jgi:preprotein translocase subunit YajC
MPTWLLLLQDPSATPPTNAAPELPGATEPVPSSPLWLQFAPFAILIALFYFLMLRPEKKQRQKREQMLRAIQKGQRVILSSGLHGRIATLDDETVTLQVDEGVRLKFARAAIQQVLDADGSEAKEPDKSDKK